MLPRAIASEWSHCTGKVPSDFSEALKPSDKSRPFAPLDRQNFLKKRAARAEKSVIFRLKKVTFQWGEGRFCDPDIFCEKKPVGSSFHVILMLVHARTGHVAVLGLEKMLAKVQAFLREVSL